MSLAVAFWPREEKAGTTGWCSSVSQPCRGGHVDQCDVRRFAHVDPGLPDGRLDRLRHRSFVHPQAHVRAGLLLAGPVRPLATRVPCFAWDAVNIIYSFSLNSASVAGGVSGGGVEYRPKHLRAGVCWAAFIIASPIFESAVVSVSVAFLMVSASSLLRARLSARQSCLAPPSPLRPRPSRRAPSPPSLRHTLLGRHCCALLQAPCASHRRQCARHLPSSSQYHP